MPKTSENVISEDINPWTYQGTSVTEVPEKMMEFGHWDVSSVGSFASDEYFGFVYLITHIQSQRKYIGRKQLKSVTRHKIKGKIRRKVVTKDSNWKEYTSSSDVLNAEIETYGKNAFTFQIIKLCKTKGELGYSEVEEQFARDVLKAKLPDGTREYYNNNIMSRWFNSSTPSTREKIRKSTVGNQRAKGSVRTPEMKEKYSVAKKGVPKSVDHRKKLAEANIGKIQTTETKQKRSDTMSALKWWTDGSSCKRAVICPEGWKSGRLPFKKTDGSSSS